MLKSVFFLIFLLLTGCISVGDTTPPTRVVTATPNQLATLVNSTLPPLAVSMYSPEQIPAESAPETAPEPPLPPKPCTDTPAEARIPQYTINAVLDWAAHTVEVEQQVIYTNTTGLEQSELVFMVEPNRIDVNNFFTLNEVKTDDDRVIENISLDQTRMSVPLPVGLGIDCTVTLNLAFRLQIPDIEALGRIGYFGFTDRQTNLGHWLPVVAMFSPTREWYTPRPVEVGEQITTQASNFFLTLQVINAPPSIVIAGPGIVRPLEDETWEFTLEKARDLTISIGNGFRTSRKATASANGTVIEVYYFPENEPAGLDAAGHAAEAASQALLLYEDQFGVAYPHKRLVVVEGDFPDGMEFSGLVFVSEAWFSGWRGQPNEWLTVITVHEVAHQWWYALIGNDPAAYPYLDEAFATYSEFLFFERYYPDRTQWWWDFRVAPYSLDGAVDSDVYRYPESRPYINAVYLRGAQMLHTMRTQLGDEGFFDWLMSYAEESQYEIVTPVELWAELPPDQYATSEEIRQRYFDRWGILPEPTATPAN